MKPDLFCPHCGNVGKGTMRGSLLITLFLLITTFFGGIIYEIWRMAGGRSVCQKCGASAMIPLDSPLARLVQAKMKAGDVA